MNSTMRPTTPALLPRSTTRIAVLRCPQVMIGADLAALYDVTTNRLNEQVKRNADRFPTTLCSG
jgi:ORF6N domain